MRLHNIHHREIFLSSILTNTAIFGFLIYLITIKHYAINQPAGDDYDAILAFLNHIQSLKPLEQLLLLFQQHNEHRIFLTRLAAVIDIKVFGEINFVHLIWFGNLGWITAILGFFIFTRKYLSQFSESIPAVIILLSFSHFDMMTWAMTSISQYWQVCFSIFAIGFMINNRFVASQLFYFFALFTSGGGIALAPLMTAYYLVQKKWKCLGLNIILSITLISIYFLVLPYNAPPSSRILDALNQPLIVLGYFLGFIGGLGNNLSIGIASILLCGLILFALFLKKCKFMYLSTPYLWWLVVYIFTTAILAALNRSVLGIASSGDSRYSEFSLLFLASLYVAYIAASKSTSQKVKIKWLGFLIAIVIYAYWYEQSKQPMIDRHYWLENHLQTHPNWSAALEIRRRSIELGIMK